MLKVANSVIDASRITGVLPVVNGGTGVTTSTGTGNTVLSAAPTLSGNVTLSTGNLIIGTNGKGIDFSVTPSSGTNSVLNDYEEGYYTATLTCGTSGTITVNPSFQTLQYTKIGRMVYVTGYITASAVSSPLGALRLNLPFATLVSTQRAGTSASYMQINGATTGLSNAFYINIQYNGVSSAIIYLSAGTSAVDAAAQIQGGGNTDITINFSYAAN